MTSTINRPVGRYGEEQPTWYRAGARGLVLALGVLGLGFVIWAGIAGGSKPVTGTLVTYKVIDDARVDFALDIASEHGRAASCTVEAMGPRQDVVGVATVSIAASDQDRRRVTGSVVTQQHAQAARLAGCSAP